MKDTRKPGKVITTIQYQRKGHNLKLEMRLAKHHNLQSGSYDESLWFFVDLDHPTTRLKHKEAEALRQMVFDHLDKTLTITWERKIVVFFSAQRTHHSGSGEEQSQELDFHYEFCDFGTTVTGEHVHYDLREWEGKLDRCGGAPDSGWPTDREFEDHVISAIDYTANNIAKVKAICSAFTLLAERIGDLLQPKKIETTLANVKTLGLPFKG